MNPYFAYCISFTIAMAFYLLGWSDAYPPFSIQLFGFLLATIIGFVLVGIFWNRKHRPPKIQLAQDSNATLVTCFIYLLWIADFVYEGGIPLFKILLQQDYNYRAFGIPTLHVFTVTFSSFYTIYLFHLHLSTKKRQFLWLYILNLLAAILIYNRGMLMFNICSSAFLFLPHTHTIPKRIVYLTPLLAVLLFYVFGIIGNLRVSHGEKASYNNSIFLNTGKATQEFRSSIIPKEFFWTYIYTSSPLANLQTNINRAERHSLSWPWFLKMVNNEMVFDFLSKRINEFFKIPHPGSYTINGSFNVSTIYSVIFSHLSWKGLVIMAFYLLLVPLAYRKLIPSSSPFTQTGLAILTTMYLFMAFENTIRFTGLSFQLVYPIAFGFLEKNGLFILRKLPSVDLATEEK